MSTDKQLPEAMAATIEEAMATFGQQFLEASDAFHSVAPVRLTNMPQACASIKAEGNVIGTFREFLQTPDLPPYYKMKANFVLSSADEEEEPWENVAACRHYLNEADKAMAECKEVYKSAEEVRQLQVFEEYIVEERQALRECVREIDSDSE